MGKQVVSALLGGQVCDFCGSTPIVTAYPAGDFKLPLSVAGIEMNSIGEWYACVECKPIIDRNDVDALAVRAMETYEKQVGRPVEEPTRSTLLEGIKRTHTTFFGQKKEMS